MFRIISQILVFGIWYLVFGGTPLCCRLTVAAASLLL